MTMLENKPDSDLAAEHKRLQRRVTRRRWLGYSGIYMILGLFAIAMIFPFVYMFFTSLKDTSDVFTYPPRVLPYEAETIEVEGEELPVFTSEAGC